MPVSAATLRVMMDAGLSGEALLAVVEAVDRDATPARSPAADRQARYRERRDLTTTEWARLRGYAIDRDGCFCRYCNSPADPPFVNHIVPLSKGGSNDPDNLAVACGRCNSSKAGKSLCEWECPAWG